MCGSKISNGRDLLPKNILHHIFPAYKRKTDISFTTITFSLSEIIISTFVYVLPIEKQKEENFHTQDSNRKDSNEDLNG